MYHFKKSLLTWIDGDGFQGLLVGIVREVTSDSVRIVDDQLGVQNDENHLEQGQHRQVEVPSKQDFALITDSLYVIFKSESG